MLRIFLTIVTCIIIFTLNEVNVMSVEFQGDEAIGMDIDKDGVIKYQLNNGMTVILEENQSAPVTAVNVWVKTGSACEEEGEYGLAHVHEHMLFKGTERRDVGEIARIIESGGGDINAFTSFDETVYFVVSASRFLDTSLDVLADAMENSAFDPEELEKELEVVLEEIRRGEDTPSRVLSQKMFSTAYDVHPYKRPVIGTTESVSSFTRDKIINFYRKWYSPQNMALVVVGDFNSKELIPKIDNTFGKIERRDIPECKLPKEKTQKNLKTFVLNSDINEGYYSFAFHGSAAKDDDTPVMDIISNILGSGDSSRLFRVVKEEKALVNNIYTYSFTPKDEGLFVVGGTIDPKKTKEAFGEIIRQVYKLKYEPVSIEEIEKAKVNILSDSIYTKETMQGQAQKLGFFEVETGDYKYEKEYLKKIEKVTADDIQRVANKYFQDSNLSVGILIPNDKYSISEKDLSKIITQSSRISEREFKTSKSKKEHEDQTKIMLDNGITLLIKENNTVPIFAARAVLLGGVRYETDKTNGVSNFLSEMLTRGTKTRSAEDIAIEIESIAGEIDGFSGKNSFGIVLEALSKNFDQAMELFSDVIQNPSFNEEEIERARRQILASINRQQDNLVRTTVNLFLKELYTQHPYRFNNLGTSESVTEIDRNGIIEFYNKLVKPENLVISVAGDVDRERVIKTIEKNFSGFKKSGFTKKNLKQEPEQNKIREAFEYNQDKAQTHIILGFQGPELDDNDIYAFEVLNSVMAGQGGRLFLELRDKKSLAYTVTSFLTPGIESGYFGVYIGTAPQKEEEAIEGIKEQLSILLEKGITDEELKRAQNYIVGNFEISLQQNSTQASKMAFDEIYGIGWENYQTFPDKIYDVTKEDVLKVARKYIDLGKYTLVVVKSESS